MRRLLGILLTVCLVMSTVAAWAYWTAGSATGGNGAAAVSTVNQGATPTASAVGYAVTVAWAPTTLTSGQAVTGYTVKRYSGSTAQTILSACTGTVTGTSCVENNVPTGVWTYSVTPVFATNWVGTESAKSTIVTVAPPDSTAPTNNISLSTMAGGSYRSGNTLYYLGAAVGSFQLTNAVSDAGSGPASSATAALGGTATGWSHTPSTVSTPSLGPYVSNTFSWTAGTTSGPTEVVTGRDVAGNTAQTTLTFVNDSSGPSGGTVTYAARTSVDTTVSVAFDAGTDAGSGVGTRLLQRASATLTGSTCLAFGAFTTVNGGTNPTSPLVDTTISGNCYMYRYVVADNVGNLATVTSVNVWKVAIATQNAYVANFGTSNVTPVNVTTGTTSGPIAVGAGPRGVAFTPDGTKAYVTNTTAGTVSVITVATGAIAATITVGTGPRGVAFTPDGTKAYVTNYSGGTVTPITVATNTAGTAITGFTNPSGVAFTPDGTKAYVTNNGTTTVTPITVATNTKGTPITVGSGPTGVAFTPDGTKAYVANFTSGTVTPITVATNTAGTAITVGTQPFGLAITPDGTKAYVTNYGSGTVTPITVVTNTAGTAITGLTNPYGVAFAPDGTKAYVTNYGLGTVTPITVATGTAGTAITVGTNPYGVAMVPDQGPTAALAAIIGAAAGSPVSLDATASTGTTTAIATYTFDFGDASTPTTTSSPTTTHTYISGGSYTVTLTVTDTAGTSTTRVFTGQTVSRNGSAAATATRAVTIAAADTTGPTGGSVDASGLVGTGSRYAASTTLSLNLAKGTDPDGVATTGNLLKRATATLTSGGTADGSCGAFGSYSTVSGGTDPVSPKSDTVSDQACYRYQYVVLDTLGNPSTYTSPDIKVDLTAPAAPTLAHSAFTNTYWIGGAVVYYRSVASSGSFTTTSTAADTASGIVSTTFPALGTNWTSTPGALGVNTYSWSGAPAAPGTKNVTATNNASIGSSTSFTPTADDTAPTGGTVTYAGGVTTGTSVSVSFTSGTDALTGIGTRLLQRAAAPLTDTTCGTFGSFATVTNGTNPTSPLTDTISSGSCYTYQYVVADGVGNLATFTSGNIVKGAATYSATIVATGGLVNYWRLGETLSTSPMADSKGTNNGTYYGTPTMAAAGAIAGSSDTAVQFNGTSQYASAARQIQDDLSIEFWFKSSQSAGVNCNQWWDGMRLVDAEVSGPNSDFGVSLCQGKIIGGVGNSADLSIVTPLTYNNNAWHHVVFTRTKSPAAMQLYVDGALVVAGTPNNTGSLTASSTIALGRAAGGGSFYSGLLDEVAVYNSVLSGTTISSHYLSGTTVANTVGPTGGSVDATGLVGTGSRYAASTTLSLNLAKGTDPDGVATTGNLLKRATATLTSGGTADGSCGAFGSYSTVSGGTDPVSPKSDTVSDQACYSYQYVVLDTQGNSTTYTSPAIKVDLAAPAAPSLAYSGFTNTYWPGSGTTVYYRSAASSGSFVATATATDAGSGILSYSFPTLGTSWTSTPGALGVNAYSWSGAPAASGTQNVTATNNATGVSGGTSFTPTADDTAPSAGSVTPPSTPQASTSVSVAFTTGTDGGSGVGTRLLQRRSATLTDTTCGSYGGWTTAATNPASSPFTDTVTGGSCYQYQYVVADNVGNTNTATSGNVVQVTTASTTVKAQYKNNEPTTPDNNSIQPHVQLVNTSASGVDLSTITVRYWFTTEAGASTFAAPCYYASVSCSNVTTSVVAVSPRTGADAYLLVGFLPSFTVAAGASSEVQLGLNKTDWSNFSEADDYSYGTGTTYTDSTKVTVYQNGTLIWGTEP